MATTFPEFLDYSPEDVLQMGLEQGLPADDIAGGLMRHRANVEGWGREQQPPENYWKGALQLDQDTETALGKLRLTAEREALSRALPEEQDRLNLAYQLEASGYDPDAVDETLRPGLDAVLQVRESAAYQMPQRVYGGEVAVGNVPLARYALREAGDGMMDASLLLPDDSEALVRVPKATREDVQAEMERSQQAVATARAEAAALMTKAKNPLAALGGGSQALVAMAETQEKRAARDELRLQALERGGPLYLMGERVRDELKKPEWRERVGEVAGWEEFTKGLADATLTTGALVARVAGADDWMQDLAQAQEALDEVLPGSTRRRLEGGIWNESVGGAQRALGMMAPSLGAGGAARLATAGAARVGLPGAAAELTRQQAGRLGVAGAGMSASAGGGAYLQTQRMIEGAEAAGDMERANRLRLGRDAHALLTGVAEGFVERLGAAQAFNLGGRGVGAAARGLLGEAAEEPVTGVLQRGVVDPLTIEETPDVFGPVPTEALTGLLAAGPLVGGAAVMQRVTGGGAAEQSGAPAGGQPGGPAAPSAAAGLPMAEITPLAAVARRGGRLAPVVANEEELQSGLTEAGAVEGDVTQGVQRRPAGAVRMEAPNLESGLVDPGTPEGDVSALAITPGDAVMYEGYTGRLTREGVRLVVETADGLVVDVENPAGLRRVAPAAPAAPAPVASPPPAAAREETPADPKVREAGFSPAENRLAIQDESGRMYVPHNRQLLRTIRTGPNGTEVLVRREDQPGRIIRLVGAQAQAAEAALLEAAVRLEAAGQRVFLGTPRERSAASAPAAAPMAPAEMPAAPAAAVETAQAEGFELTAEMPTEGVTRQSRTGRTGPTVEAAPPTDELELFQWAAQRQVPVELQEEAPPPAPSTGPAMVNALRLLNAELPERARAAWTEEVYAKAARYLQTGAASELDGLTQVQRRRVMQARLEMNPEARAEQEKVDRREEDRQRKQEKSDRKLDERTNFKAEVDRANRGFRNLVVARDLEAGVLTVDGVEALVELARAAMRSGTKLAEWTAEMVRRFGDAVRAWAANAWQAVLRATDAPTNAAANVRMGRPQGAAPVGLADAGAVLNPWANPAGGTAVFHTRGEPFRVNGLSVRQMLTGSPLPAALVPVLDKTNLEKGALEATAAALGRDLDAALVSAADRLGMPRAVLEQRVNDFLDGAPGAAAVLNAVDSTLFDRARPVRNLTDDLSVQVARILPVGPLRQTLVNNLGSWMRRAYDAFDPASGWNFDNVMKAALAGRTFGGRDARAIVRAAARTLNAQAGYSGMLDANGLPREGTPLEADLRDLMDRGTWERGLTGPGGVRQNVGSFMQRKVMPSEIRALMGERTNPVERFAGSVRFQSQYLARHHGQRAMRTVGLASGLFSASRAGVFTEQIPTEGNQWSGLGGLWTTPQLMQALERAAGVTQEGTEIWGVAGKVLRFLSAKAKLNRVAMNPDSTAVNLLGGVSMMLANGDWYSGAVFRRLNESIRLQRAGRAKAGDQVNAVQEALQDAQRDMAARLTAAGVLGSGLTLADLEASLPRAMNTFLDMNERLDRAAGAVEGAIIGQAVGRGLGVPGRLVGAAVGAAAGGAVGGRKLRDWQMRVADWALQKPDMLFRVTGFLTNYETALAAGMSTDAAMEWASTRTLNTFPNYAAVPAFLRELSRYGAINSFVSFMYEMYRNTAWTIRAAREELSSGNPALQRRGLQRLAGLGTLGVLMGGGLKAGLMFLAGGEGDVGGDDERNQLFNKWFAAPWEKDAVLAFTKYDKDGVSYLNTSYILPQNVIAELATAVANGENPADSAGRVVERLLTQFAGDSVNLTPLLQAWANQKATGAKITYKEGAAGALERMDHALRVIGEPGFADKIERLTFAFREAERRGRSFSVEQELRRVMGLREVTRTWDDLALNRYRDFSRRNSDIRADANRTLGEGLPGASARALEAANAKLAALREEVASFERDAVKLGVPGVTLRTAKGEANVPRVIADVVLDPTGKRVKSMGR